MCEQLAVLAVFTFCYSAVSGRVARLPISGPLIFVLVGLALGPPGLGWLSTGVSVIGQSVRHFTWDIVLYAILSLTVIRMVSVFLSLAGTGETTPDKLFLGWFGPRGLASIVFAIIVIEESLPGSEFMVLVVACTVGLSLAAHGISANPLSSWIARETG